jgi:hypothetical protein
MVLHRPSANAKINGDILAGVARQHQIHDLPLAASETGEERERNATRRRDFMRATGTGGLFGI